MKSEEVIKEILRKHHKPSDSDGAWRICYDDVAEEILKWHKEELVKAKLELQLKELNLPMNGGSVGDIQLDSRYPQSAGGR